MGLKNWPWEDTGLFLKIILPRALWSLGNKKKKKKNHLTACNGATPETIFPFPFFVNGGPETAPVLGGEEEWSTESEAEKGKGGFPFFPFLSLIFFFLSSFWLITAK